MLSNILQNLNEPVIDENIKRKKYRKCSFCNNTGHNVAKCDDLRLCTFKRYLFYIKSFVIYF